MPKLIWDLKAGEPVTSRKYGEAVFVGFFADGLECNIMDKFALHIVPVTDLVMDGDELKAFGSTHENAIANSN